LKTQVVDVLVYARNTPKLLYAHNKMTTKLTPAFTDEVGIQCWMAYTGDGIFHQELVRTFSNIM
jgi:hypothetical protein